MSYTIYTDPRSGTIGTTSIASLTQVAWSVQREEILDAGDDDETWSVARHGLAAVRGHLELLDTAEASNLAGARGRLQFIINDLTGQADKIVRIDNVSLGQMQQQTADGKPPSCRLEFLSPDLPVILSA